MSNTVYNTTLSLKVEGDNIVSKVNKSITLDVETKTEKLYQINSTDGWKEIDTDDINNIKLILFYSTIAEDSFKVRFTLYDDVSSEVFGTGDGSSTNFIDNLANTLIQEGTVTFTYEIGGVEYTATDDGEGTITGTGISDGTIVYSTGLVDIDFSTAIDSGVIISVDYSYLDTSNLSLFECSDLLAWCPASTYDDNVSKIEIATDSTTDVEIMVQVLGISS